MVNILIIIIYVASSLFLYNYCIYPACIIIISKLVGDHDRKNVTEGKAANLVVSFIIAAYNEDKVIAEKLINTLKIDYPLHLFEIIVVSDGSNDNTAGIVKEFQHKGVISLHENKRNGKSAALNRGVEISKGEIIIFSDANNNFNIDSIHQLVKHFDDPKIGAVTGAKHIYDNRERQSSAGDGLYWKYESKIKEAESTLGSITGAEGEILAVRKNLFKPIDKSIINDDAAITFGIVKSGHRIIYEKEAKAFEDASIDLIDDFNVKVRMTAGGYQTLSIEKGFLFPPTSWFSFTFISHKVLRWFAPHLLLIVFIIPIFLFHRLDMIVFFMLQILFYAISLFGWFNRKKKLPSLIYVPMYFTVMNMALFWGFIRYINKNTKSIWKKAER